MSHLSTDITTFARIGDVYYQMVNGELIKRDKREIKDDGVNIKSIEQYYGFTVEHDFENYRLRVNNFYNLSNPLQHKECNGNFPTIEKMFKHIFQHQVDIGYDRYQLLLQQPTQIQPILVLVSELQGTGKTSLLDFDKVLFGSNAVISKMSEYIQPFNAVYASKLVIGIDESSIDENFIKQRIKQDSTAKTILLRKMHSEHKLMPFFGKFTLCSNREKDFAHIEKSDIRFWIIKVPKLKEFNPNFLSDIEKEIPAFLYWIKRRTMSVPVSQSRQWFSQEQLKTDALENCIEHSKSKLAKDILIYVQNKMEDDEVKTMGATASDFVEIFNRKYSISEITNVLVEELKLPKPVKRRYINYHGVEKQSRPFNFFLDEKNDVP
ncbi:MAG: hypothetical protein JZU53_04715 [Paludibacter sp.]|nr:hypothetical protein [Paludibacter sp.]